MRIGFIKLLIACSILMVACQRKYKPIDYGSDGCEYCKMTILDERYGSELINDKGKIFKFDDIVCLRQFMNENGIGQEASMIFVEKYNSTKNDVTDAIQAVYLHGEFFASPMNGNYAAFENSISAQYLSDSLNLNILSWNNLN